MDLQLKYKQLRPTGGDETAAYEVARMNIEKLRDRAMRNVIIGEGDNR